MLASEVSATSENIRTRLYSQHFIFFVTNERAHY
jgi:hypothetical protein